MLTRAEIRREALLAIERALVRQFEVMRIPVPTHYWSVSSDNSYANVKLVCVDDCGEKIAMPFSTEELDSFDVSARFETYAKISAIASKLIIDQKTRRS